MIWVNLLSNPFKVFYFSEFLPCTVPRAACLWTSSWQALANLEPLPLFLGFLFPTSTAGAPQRTRPQRALHKLSRRGPLETVCDTPGSGLSSITVLRKVSQDYLLVHHLPPSNLPVLSSSCSCTRSMSCLHKSCHIHSASDFCLHPHWNTHVETRLTWN